MSTHREQMGVPPRDYVCCHCEKSKYLDQAVAFLGGWRKDIFGGDWCSDCEDVRRVEVDRMRVLRGLSPLYEKGGGV